MQFAVIHKIRPSVLSLTGRPKSIIDKRALGLVFRFCPSLAAGPQAGAVISVYLSFLLLKTQSSCSPRRVVVRLTLENNVLWQSTPGAGEALSMGQLLLVLCPYFL